MSRQCYFCKGKTGVKNIDVDFRWEGKLYVIRDVPVEVCNQCGERYYSSDVSKKIDHLVQIGQPQQTIKVPVLEFS